MNNGEILFIIAPSNYKFSEITYQSLTRHKKKLYELRRFGFYIFKEDNKEEWNIYENKYLNILNICEKYKNFYDMAIVLSGNIFFNINNFSFFNDFIVNVYNVLKKSKDAIVAGTSYMDQINTMPISHNRIDILSYYKNNDVLKKLIDYDFCFIDLAKLKDFDSIFNIIHKNKNILNYPLHKGQLLLNNFLLKNSVMLKKGDELYLKKNIQYKIINQKLKNTICVYKFTDNYFPLKKLKDESCLNLYNYYIFNKLFDEYVFLDKSKLDDELCYYIEKNHIKTFFTGHNSFIKELSE